MLRLVFRQGTLPVRFALIVLCLASVGSIAWARLPDRSNSDSAATLIAVRPPVSLTSTALPQAPECAVPALELGAIDTPNTANLQPVVPEPITLLVLLLGSVGLSWSRPRHK